MLPSGKKSALGDQQQGSNGAHVSPVKTASLVAELEIFSRDRETEVPKEARAEARHLPREGVRLKSASTGYPGLGGSMGPGVRNPGLNPSSNLLSVGPGANYLTSLSKYFLTYKN